MYYVPHPSACPAPCPILSDITPAPADGRQVLYMSYESVKFVYPRGVADIPYKYILSSTVSFPMSFCIPSLPRAHAL